MANALDRLPLEVLLALQDALAAPGPVGAERARQRAEDAGFYLVVMGEPLGPPPPIAMEEGPALTDPDAEGAVHLSFGAPAAMH